MIKESAADKTVSELMNAIADIPKCTYSGCQNLVYGGFSRCDLHLTRDALRYATNPEYRERHNATMLAYACPPVSHAVYARIAARLADGEWRLTGIPESDIGLIRRMARDVGKEMNYENQNRMGS